MISASVQNGALALQTAVVAARPLALAPSLQISALVRQGNELLATVDGAIASEGPRLDDVAPSGPLPAVVAAVNDVIVAGADLDTLHDLRGFLGRAVLNLAQTP